MWYTILDLSKATSNFGHKHSLAYTMIILFWIAGGQPQRWDESVISPRPNVMSRHGTVGLVYC